MSRARLRNAAVGGFLALLFFGAMLWAKGRDPFERTWFKVKVRGQAKVECVVVRPKVGLEQSLKSEAGRRPVVVYLHGAGGNLLGSGNDLRQIAEMGVAAVGMDYCQTNETIFDAQFSGLLRHLGRQPWADTNRVAWVGFSLGAQRLLSFALRHPAQQPKLLVRLAGGWIPELNQFKVQGSGFEVQSSKAHALSPSPLTPHPSTQVLMIHGEHDQVFPLSVAQTVATCLQTNGVPAELKVLPGESHGFGANRGIVFRVVGEQCLTRLEGTDALEGYQSILWWQAKAWPLWVCWLPAVVWGGVWGWRRWNADCRMGNAECGERSGGSADCGVPSAECRVRASLPRLLRLGGARLRWWEVALCWLAVLVGAGALAQTAVHFVAPRLGVGKRTLAIGRNHLVPPKARKDFEFLAAQDIWRGKPLETLLEHLELANYNRELINWKLEGHLYRDYVLSAGIDPAADGNLNWRRPLWENFYPRIRREQSPEAAAEIVVRFLRERVTVAQGGGLPGVVAEIWRRQITDERGFEAIYVAAMRAVGIPSRLGSQARAELWTGSAWQAAPRALVERWE